MPWQMEVKIEIPPARLGDLPSYEWHAVHPTHGRPYQYPTRLEAVRMLQMCYPDQTPDQVRVQEVP